MAAPRVRFQAITIENFRSFGSVGGRPVRVPLGGLTFLFGANSAGKSSISMALRLLCATAAARRADPAAIGSTMSRLLHWQNGQQKKRCRIGVELARPDSSTAAEESDDGQDRLDAVGLAVERATRFELRERERLEMWFDADGLVRIAHEDRRFERVGGNEFECGGSRRRLSAIRADDDGPWGSLASVLDAVAGVVEHVSPVRQPIGRRHLALTTGELADRVAGRSADVGRWLSRLHPDHELDLQRLDHRIDGTEFATLRIRHRRVGNESLAFDEVGSGVTQVLQVVVSCVAPIGSVVVFEQPELHLNPLASIELGTLFLEAMGEAQLIVETHSDLPLLRICRDLRLGEPIDPAAIVMASVSNDGEGSGAQTTVHELHADGFVDPPLFDSIMEVMSRELFWNPDEDTE